MALDMSHAVGWVRNALTGEIPQQGTYMFRLTIFVPKFTAKVCRTKARDLTDLNLSSKLSCLRSSQPKKQAAALPFRTLPQLLSWLTSSTPELPIQRAQLALGFP